MTSSTKPEILNTSQCRQRKTESRPQKKFGEVWSRATEKDNLTNRQSTNTLIVTDRAFFALLPGQNKRNWDLENTRNRTNDVKLHKHRVTQNSDL